MEDAVRVLIADSNDGFRALLGECVSGLPDMQLLGSARDGEQALELVRQLRPDVLIFDLMLRKTDGLSLLRRLREEELRLCTIVVSGFFNDRLAETVSRLGADYFFPKPCRMEDLLAAVRDFGSTDRRRGPDSRQDMLVRGCLMAWGITPNLSGFEYLRSAADLVLCGECPSRGVTKILYPALARRHGSTAPGVERCIRHAIRSGWEEGDGALRLHFLGESAAGRDKPPSNSAFLSLLVENVRRHLCSDQAASL